CSKRWRAAAPSWQRGSAGRRSSSRRRPAFSSTRSMSTRWRAGSNWPPRCRARTRLLARRRRSTTSAGKRDGSSRSSPGPPPEVSEPDLDEWLDPTFEPRLACQGEGFLPALARLGRIDALLEAVGPGHEQLLDPSADV